MGTETETGTQIPSTMERVQPVLPPELSHSDDGCGACRTKSGDSSVSQDITVTDTVTALERFRCSRPEASSFDLPAGPREPKSPEQAETNAKNDTSNKHCTSFSFVRWVYVCFLAASFAGAAPRATVLLISRALPQAALQSLEHEDGFKELWRPCRGGAAFSSFGPGGVFYLFTVLSDQCFGMLGTTMISMGCLAAMCVHVRRSTPDRRVIRILFLTFLALQVATFLATYGSLVSAHMGTTTLSAMSQARDLIPDFHRYAACCLFFVAYAVFSRTAASANVSVSSSRAAMPHGGEMAPMIRGTVRTKMLALKYFFVFLIFLLMGGATSWMSRNIIIKYLCNLPRWRCSCLPWWRQAHSLASSFLAQLSGLPHRTSVPCLSRPFGDGGYSLAVAIDR
jgi:hypothetical protein